MPAVLLNGTESLSTASGEMMRHSDNTRRANQRHVLASTISLALPKPMASITRTSTTSSGVAVPFPINRRSTIWECSMNKSPTAGCGTTNRDMFYSLMAGKAQFHLEGYDWTGLWDTDIPNLINQEAPPGMSTVSKAAFPKPHELGVQGAGNYKICGSTCATYVDHLTDRRVGADSVLWREQSTFRDYVFGLFINNSTSDTMSSNTFNATKAELLREQIRAGLANVRQPNGMIRFCR